eukprot:9428649-Pyramimonas_sp.AAC.1
MWCELRIRQRACPNKYTSSPFEKPCQRVEPHRDLPRRPGPRQQNRPSNHPTIPPKLPYHINRLDRHRAGTTSTTASWTLGRSRGGRGNAEEREGMDADDTPLQLS